MSIASTAMALREGRAHTTEQQRQFEDIVPEAFPAGSERYEEAPPETLLTVE